METFPSTNLFTDVGPITLSEYNYEDGCNKIRVLPHFVITEPIRKRPPSRDCDTSSYIITEWSSSYQAFITNGPSVTCLDHALAIRLSYGPGFNYSILRQNVLSFLDAYSITGGLAEPNNRVDRPFT